MLAGADGFSGIMANYHSELYVRMLKNLRTQPEKPRKLSAFLSLMSSVEGKCHPVCAKYHMNRVGVPMPLNTGAAGKLIFLFSIAMRLTT